MRSWGATATFPVHRPDAAGVLRAESAGEEERLTGFHKVTVKPLDLTRRFGDPDEETSAEQRRRELLQEVEQNISVHVRTHKIKLAGKREGAAASRTLTFNLYAGPVDERDLARLVVDEYVESLEFDRTAQLPAASS